jgi:hypothetical protein
MSNTLKIRKAAHWKFVSEIRNKPGTTFGDPVMVLPDDWPIPTSTSGSFCLFFSACRYRRDDENVI